MYRIVGFGHNGRKTIDCYTNDAEQWFNTLQNGIVPGWYDIQRGLNPSGIIATVPGTNTIHFIIVAVPVMKAETPHVALPEAETCGT